MKEISSRLEISLQLSIELSKSKYPVTHKSTVPTTGVQYLAVRFIEGQRKYLEYQTLKVRGKKNIDQ